MNLPYADFNHLCIDIKAFKYSFTGNKMMLAWNNKTGEYLIFEDLV